MKKVHAPYIIMETVEDFRQESRRCWMALEFQYDLTSLHGHLSRCSHPYLSYTQSSPARRLQVPVSNSTGIYSCSAASPSEPTGRGDDGSEAGKTLGNFHAHLDYYIL